MKKYLLAVVVMFSFASLIAIAEVKEMTFVTENKADYPSLTGDSDNIDAEKPGATVEAIKLMGKKLGIKVNFKRVPWKRALEVELKNGESDGLFTASYKKEREEFGAYPVKNGKVDETRRISTVGYSFFRLKGSNVDYDGSELKNFKGKIGAPLGYSIVDDLKKKGYAVDESNGTLTDLKKLAANRISVIAALELTGDILLEKNPDLGKQIEKIETPLASKAYYIMLSNQFVKANPELAEKIWDTIRDIRENEYKDIVKKYID